MALKYHDGHPMQPCFTLRIPEPYRAKGPDYVALSVFADQQHDEPDEVEADRRISGREDIRSAVRSRLAAVLELHAEPASDGIRSAGRYRSQFRSDLADGRRIGGTALPAAAPAPAMPCCKTTRRRHGSKRARPARRSIFRSVSSTAWTRSRTNTGIGCSGTCPRSAMAPMRSRLPCAKVIPMWEGRQRDNICMRANSATTSRPTARRPSASIWRDFPVATISAAPCSPANGRPIQPNLFRIRGTLRRNSILAAATRNSISRP